MTNKKKINQPQNRRQVFTFTLALIEKEGSKARTRTIAKALKLGAKGLSEKPWPWISDRVSSCIILVGHL